MIEFYFRRTQDKDYVHKHYSVYTKSNSKMVDSSIERRSEYHFTIGAGEVIQGMDIGIRDMCVGEMRRLYMPPHLGRCPTIYIMSLIFTCRR